MNFRKMTHSVDFSPDFSVLASPPTSKKNSTRLICLSRTVNRIFRAPHSSNCRKNTRFNYSKHEISLILPNSVMNFRKQALSLDFHLLFLFQRFPTPKKSSPRLIGFSGTVSRMFRALSIFFVELSKISGLIIQNIVKYIIFNW